MAVFRQDEARIALELLQNASPEAAWRLMEASKAARRAKTHVNVTPRLGAFCATTEQITGHQAWLIAYAIKNPDKVDLDELRSRLRRIVDGTAEPDNLVVVGK